MAASPERIINAGFEILAKNIELSLVEYTSVRRCQADIEAYLGKYITTFTTELPGAFARKTMVAPLKGNVVDMLVLFNEKHSSTFLPDDLLGKLHVTLLAKYPGTTFDKLSESVFVPVEDFRFRVQPGFLTEKNHFLTPGPSWNEWVEYDSLGYASEFSKENARHGGKLLNLVRMIKTWNRLSGNAFDGYFLELLIRDVINSYEIVTYQEAINYVFKSILADVALKKHDPANQSLQVEGLHDLESIVNEMIHVKSSYLVTQEAIKNEEEQDVKSALLNWGQLFPGHFSKLKS